MEGPVRGSAAPEVEISNFIGLKQVLDNTEVFHRGDPLNVQILVRRLNVPVAGSFSLHLLSTVTAVVHKGIWVVYRLHMVPHVSPGSGGLLTYGAIEKATRRPSSSDIVTCGFFYKLIKLLRIRECTIWK